MALLVLIVWLGPAETLSGKYLKHSPEYLDLHPQEAAPLPRPLPADPAALCALIEAGHGDDAELFAALGEALLAAGKDDLAYRAFRKAQRRDEDPGWRRRMQERKDAAGFVRDEVIAAEERLARLWVERLQAWERERIARGEDPRDRGEFYARYGRPEDDFRLVVARRRASFVWGIVGLLAGAAAALGGWTRRMPRWAVVVPLVVGAWCVAAPRLVGPTGLYPLGAAAALAGGAVLAVRGRRGA